MKSPWVVAIVSLAACTDGGDAKFDEAASSMEGIYQVQSFTHNDAACSDGGSSQLGTDTFAVVAAQTYFGQRVLQATSCASTADCRDKLAKLRAQQGFTLEFQFTVSGTGDAGVLVGEGVGTGFGSQTGTCTLGEVTATTFALAGTMLRIEQAITIADDYPADNGFCTTDLAKQHAKGNACSQMEVLTATFVEPL